jgi:hypothetical protein
MENFVMSEPSLPKSPAWRMYLLALLALVGTTVISTVTDVGVREVIEMAFR